MGLIKEPKHIDLVINSKPWTEVELSDFRKLMLTTKTKKRKIDTGNYKAPRPIE
jgi:hypothetical protein